MENKVYVILETFEGAAGADIKGVFSDKEEAIAVAREIIAADHHIFDDVTVSEISLNKKNYTFDRYGETVTSNTEIF